MRYIVKDSLGNFLRSFNSYQSAKSFIIMCNRYDWKIETIQ